MPLEVQDTSYDCSQESCQFMLRAWGRSPDDAWMTNEWIVQGIMTPQYGLMDASGRGMVDWLNRTYGEYGYLATNADPVSFDAIAQEMTGLRYPLACGGRAWGHWVGVRAYSPEDDVLLIHNSAPSYMGIDQTLSRGDFDRLGSFSMVRLEHP